MRHKSAARFIFLWLLAALCPLPAAELSEIFFSGGGGDTLWQSNPAFWAKKLPDSLRGENASLAKLCYYAAVTRTRNKHTLFDIPVQEMTLGFDGGKLRQIEVFIYNRGDSGKLAMTEFRNMRKSVTARLDGIAGTDSRKNSVILADSRLETLTWTWGKSSAMRLKWSRNGNTPEFLTLELAPAGSFGQLKADVRADSDPDNLSNRLRRTENGDVYLQIPMTDQGHKGYCAAATVTRVLKYYGGSIDQHIIANLAKTDPDHGTDVNILLQQLSNAAPRLNVRHKILYRNPVLGGPIAIKQMVSMYNLEAAKAKKKTIVFDKFLITRNRMRFLEVEKLYKTMDRNCFLRARMRERTAFRNFEKNIKEYIDRGIPLIWCVLGVDDTGRYLQHMRLITGYNFSGGKKRVVYSDSWGAEKGIKSMNIDHAFSITSTYFVMMPRTK